LDAAVSIFEDVILALLLTIHREDQAIITTFGCSALIPQQLFVFIHHIT